MVYEFQPACKLGMKLAGVHWWFKSRAHAAELTAGYYNTRDRNGYDPVIAVAKRHESRLSFTCVEMRDCEHPPEGRCSPQALLQQVIETAELYGVPLAGENALQRCVRAVGFGGPSNRRVWGGAVRRAPGWGERAAEVWPRPRVLGSITL